MKDCCWNYYEQHFCLFSDYCDFFFYFFLILEFQCEKDQRLVMNLGLFLIMAVGKQSWKRACYDEWKDFQQLVHLIDQDDDVHSSHL